MRIIGVDLHARQQSVAMLDADTGEVIEKTLQHEGACLRAGPKTDWRRRQSRANYSPSQNREKYRETSTE
jgi:hypothetical protein